MLRTVPASSLHARERGGPLVGRTHELEALGAALEDGRLATLTGTGGIGKTRLALHYAFAVARGRAALCDLTDARTVDDVCQVVAQALEVPIDRAPAAGSAVAQIGRALAERGPALVVLDNFEGVVSEGAPAVRAWHEAAPDVRLLVTSRERLGVDGERVFDLSPLGLPPDATEAVDLFLQRVAARGEALDERDRPVVERIVAELDGIPLAIELAAARIGVLGPAELLARLPERLDLLTGRPRDVATRQRTLRATIDGSWVLLDAHQQRALAQCSVFRGGFTVDAAEGVVELGAGAPSVLDVIEALRDKSLVQANRDDDGTRLSMYGSIHEYAAERLDADATRAAEERHRAWYTALLERVAPAVGGPEGRAAVRRLARDDGNLVAMLERGLARAAEPGAAEAALRALAALELVYRTRGPTDRHLALVDRAIALWPAEAAPPPRSVAALLARVLTGRGRARRVLGRIDEARADFERATALAASIGDAPLEGSIRSALGFLFTRQGRFGDARAQYDLARALLQRPAPGAAAPFDPRPLADLELNLGNLHLDQGRMAEARESFAAALALLREGGSVRATAAALGCLALVHSSLGETAAALGDYERALVLFRELGDARNEATVVGNMARTLQDDGQIARALPRYDEALHILRTARYRRGEIEYLAHRGSAHHELGDLAAAAADYEASLVALREVEDRRHEGLVRALWSAALSALGSRGEAARAADEAHRLLEGAGDRLALAAAAVHRAHLDLAAGNAVDAQQAVDAARHLAAESLDLRVALRLFERASARVAASSESPSPRPPPAAPDLSLDAASLVATVDAKRRVDLRNKPLLARLLLVLMTEPGGVVDKERLFEQVWSARYSVTRAAALYKAVDRLARLLTPSDPRRLFGWDEQGRLVLRARRPEVVGTRT